MHTMLSFLRFLVGAASVFIALVGCVCARTSYEACDLRLPASSLPVPPSNTSLKFVGLGVGTQNYSCAPGGVGPTPSSRGAVATLYDITDILCDNNGHDAWPLAMEDLDTVCEWNRRLGWHYFTAGLVPTFDLDRAHPTACFSGKKITSVAAPESEKTHTPAIDWLYLVADGTAPNGGDIAAAYRVNTVGGVAPSHCNGIVTVSYTAEYWFYGPP